MANKKKAKTWNEYRSDLNTVGNEAGLYGIKVSSMKQARAIIRKDHELKPHLKTNMFIKSFRIRSHG